MTFLVAQTGDVHLDSGDPASNERVLAFIADECVARGVDVFVHCGDAFASGRPPQSAWRAFYRQMAKLARAGIPVVLVEGNHERLAVPAGSRTATSVLGEALAGLPGAWVRFVDREAALVRTPTGVQVAAVPWMAGVLPPRPGLSPSEQDREAAAQIAGEIGRLAGQADAGMPLVLASHLSVSGARSGSERELAVSSFAEPVVEASAIAECGIQFAGLSHIHARGFRPPVWLAGSPNRLTFADADQVKSFNVARFDGPVLAGVDRVATPARPMSSVDLSDAGARRRLGGLEPGCQVRLVLQPGETDAPDWAVRAVADAGAVLGPLKKRPPEADVPDGVSLPEQIRPAEALEAWMARAQIPEASRPGLREKAAALVP